MLGWSAPAGPQILLNSGYNFHVTNTEFAWAVAMMPMG